MQKPTSATQVAAKRACRHSGFALASYLLAPLCIAGCGTPGEPTAPSPPVPSAIVDLTAQQAGDGVQLTFTMPTKTITGESLGQPPAVEILRGVAKPGGSTDAKSLRVVDAIPGSLVDNYVSKGQVQFTDPLAPEETKAHPGGVFRYRVRTRASSKRASADSNMVSVPVFPVPERVTRVDTRITESAIELSWQAPAHTSAGDPLTGAPVYRIYRGELEPSFADSAASDLLQAKWKSRPALLASSEKNSYRDVFFDFGKTYLYIVRSIVLEGNNPLESSDSAPAIVAPLDTFSPAPPRDLVAVVLPGATPPAQLVDLSWSINLEADLAGYRVYRSEQQAARGQLVTSELLLAPAVRDTSVQPGHRYWYSVTSVDLAGNESAPSAPLAVAVIQQSP
jgi:uncharacterized protein